jgi:capsular exopolysaccharide synthesis family protein
MSNNAPHTYSQLTDRLANQRSNYTVQEFASKYFYLLPWLLVSVGIAISIAYTRLRYINPVYSASGRVLIKTDKSGSNVFGEKLGEVVTASVNTRLMDDQVELIKSTALARLVVRSADLQQTYYFKGKLRNSLIHNPQSPIRLHILTIHDSSVAFTLDIRVLDEKQFTIAGVNTPIAFGVNFRHRLGVFRLEKRFSDFGNNKDFLVSWTPELDLARALAGGIQVGVVTKGGNVLNFVYYAEHPKVAEDIVDGFQHAYQEYSLKDKRESAVSALDFIEAQLNDSKTDLGILELQLQQFRETNKAVALSEQASGYFESLQTSGEKIAEQAINIKMLDHIISYVNDEKNSAKVIPMFAEVKTGNALDLITNYNKLLLQKEISLQTVPKGSPIIIDYNLSLDKLKGEIILSLNHLKDNYVAVQESLKLNEFQSRLELKDMPRKERQLLDITRQQKVMEELYASLLQKKLQTSISTASTLSNIQLLESAYSSGMPVTPQPRSFYTTAILIGILIPLALAFLLEFLNDKVRTKEDIESVTAVPMLGEIGHVSGDQTLVISSRDRKFISEQFRIVRTSLQYILSEGKKTNVILVTSSMSGEGKSFIATNMAAVVAVSGKKTVLIEFDIRKPRLMKGLGMYQTDKKGLTHFLIGKADVEEIIQKVDGVDNLYIIPCGLVPPNPAELILSERLKQLFVQLEQNFDMIIVDSPPVGLVSDGYVLGNYADATLFVVRHNYTFKKQLTLLQSIYTDRKLPHLSLVINDVKAPLGYNNYTGYLNYGYGYRNDLDHYFERDNPGTFNRIKRFLG